MVVLYSNRVLSLMVSLQASLSVVGPRGHCTDTHGEQQFPANTEEGAGVSDGERTREGQRGGDTEHNGETPATQVKKDARRRNGFVFK